MMRIGRNCRRPLLIWLYGRRCSCTFAPFTSGADYSGKRSRGGENRASRTQKCSVHISAGEKRACSALLAESKQTSCPSAKFGLYPTGVFQSSVAKFQFEDGGCPDVREEWYYVVHYLKWMVTSVEQSLNDLGVTSLDDEDVLKLFARPYHYTADDILAVRLPRSPDESICPRNSFSGTSLWRGSENAGFVDSVSVSSLPFDFIHNVSSSLDRFIASTALAVCDLVRCRCDCVVAKDLSESGGPAELIPYLDMKTFYSGLVVRPQNSYVMRCDNVPRQLLLESSGLFRLENSVGPQLMSSGQESGFTPDGSDGKPKLPNADQLRAIQDNLAYNMPKLFVSGHDYQIYTEDVVFENHWFPGCTYTTKGQMLYVLEIARLRLFIHIRLANVRIQLLKTTAHAEDGTVRVRWRVVGLPVTHAVRFWKYLPWAKRRPNSNNTQYA